MNFPPYATDKQVPRILGAALEAVIAARGDADKLKSVFDRSPIPMVLIDRRRRYVDANRPAQLFTRLSMAELERVTLDDVTPPDELPILEAIWERLLGAGFAAGPREVPGPKGVPLQIVYWGMANALPGLHAIAFAPADWSEEGIGVLVDEIAGPPASPLTPRELEVLQLAAEGLSGPKIAERLVLSPATVKTHFSNIYKKFGLSGRGAAVARGIRLGLID
ncbi:MAG: two-component system, NarL family, nitrate/nitrite response regulator NarL [Solirubrobacterales bacterium]|jgi:DNA-binding CsgD family transcriptional regulator|nr:two-component system, NarL family, nitrate/nitrite response regulator NarL [Solirubrobacterales bacterium]